MANEVKMAVRVKPGTHKLPCSTPVAGRYQTLDSRKSVTGGVVPVRLFRPTD